MWSAIKSEDFVRLINHWDDIDLKKAEFFLEQWKPEKPYKNVGVALPYGITVHFEHYLQDDTVESPTKKPGSDNEMYCNDAIQYAKEKWFSRLSRMKTPPVFLIVDNYYIMNFSDVKDIENFTHPVYFFTHTPSNAREQLRGKRVIVLNNPLEEAPTGTLARLLLKGHRDLFV